MFALMSSVVGFAQLSEVKGVETKLVIYDGQEYEYWGDNARYKSHSTKWFGYSFYNMNSIPVSVEARLYENDKLYGPRIITTKTFNLKPGEAYIWKHENMSVFEAIDRVEPKYKRYSSEGYNTYYVEYKAYKIL